MPEWVSEAYDKGLLVFTDDSIHISTLEGTMLASRGDMLIQGVEGELYPCKPDIFEKTYELVEE
jgi:hypothetical protein